MATTHVSAGASGAASAGATTAGNKQQSTSTTDQWARLFPSVTPGSSSARKGPGGGPPTTSELAHGAEVARGSDQLITWRITALPWRHTVCDRVDVMLNASGGGGYSSQCGALPLSHSEQNVNHGVARVVFGVVTLKAALVRITLGKGSVDVVPQGGGKGFGRAWYLQRVDATAQVQSIVALDERGRELARVA